MDDLTTPSQLQTAKVTWGLEYLDDVKDVRWWVVDDTTVYIAFAAPLPADFGWIVRGAAWNASKETRRTVMVWAVPADSPQGRDGGVGPLRYFCYASAEGGRVTETTCP